MDNSNLKVNLVYFNNPSLGQAWKHYFEFESSLVNIVEGNIFDIESDAIVSPGNSFGFMDGGLDLQISRRYGWQIQKELQERINTYPLGELLVGQTETIKVSNTFVICAPTMRVPTSENIPNSVNAYLATKAVLHECLMNPEIESVSFSGLCTGTGRMSPDVCAKQMFSAYCEVMKNEKPDFPSFIDAKKHHKGLTISHLQS
jgi:O-acetyl-ADP-ribose deacetylase (regulator of RNase III)